MVRILEVRELEQRKRELCARSEIYRQTLALEAANIKLSVGLMRKQMRGLRTIYRLLGWALPIGGLLAGRKQRSFKQGFLGRFLAGFNLANRIKSLFTRAAEPEPAAERADGTHKFEADR